MLYDVLLFTAAGTCLFFSLLIIVSLLVLKINKTFILLGVYFFLLSVNTLFHAILLTYPESSFSREVLTLEWVVGVAGGFPIILLIRNLRHDLLGRIPMLILFGILAVLLAIALVDFLFGFGLLFYTEPSMYIARPLMKYIYVPTSLTGLGIIAFLVFRLYRSTIGKNRKLLRTLSVGILCTFPFGYFDIINILVKDNLLKNSIYLFSGGVFIFAIFIIAFFIQLMKMHLAAVSSGIDKPTEADNTDEEMTILKQIYDKIVVNMQSRKLYLDEKITADNFAQQINESKIDVSKAINLFYKDNFNNFTNYFRVEEMKKLLSDPKQEESIVGMGIRAGFNSKTSINRIFHRYVRLTPREFRKLALRGRPADFNASLLILAVKQKQNGRK